MDDLLPADPAARRRALIILGAAAILGTVAVFWLSSYLDSLTELARTDREASLHLFRTRVLPAFIVVVLVGVVSGALLARFGLQVIRTERFPPGGAALAAPTRQRSGSAARAVGMLLAVAGCLLALLPLGILGIVIWMLGQVKP